MTKKNETKKGIFLYDDIRRTDLLSAQANSIARIINNKVIPACEMLELNTDTDTLMRYATNSTEIENDYLTKNLKGIEELAKPMQRVIRERFENDLIGAIGDGWEHYTSNDISKYLYIDSETDEYGEDEHTIIKVNTHLINEDCKVMLPYQYNDTYHRLEEICEELNSLLGTNFANTNINYFPIGINTTNGEYVVLNRCRFDLLNIQNK